MTTRLLLGPLEEEVQVRGQTLTELELQHSRQAPQRLGKKAGAQEKRNGGLE